MTNNTKPAAALRPRVIPESFDIAGFARRINCSEETAIRLVSRRLVECSWPNGALSRISRYAAIEFCVRVGRDPMRFMR